jgi:hypothetical protein
MEILLIFLLPAALVVVLLVSIPTGVDILRRGNDADPLGKEIEEENREAKAAARAA